VDVVLLHLFRLEVSPELGEMRPKLTPCLSQFSVLILSEVEMNEKLPDDQTLWFRNLPPKENDEGPKEVQERARKEPEIELFIEPLTGLAIPMPSKEKKGGK
jgi:hypothetical protein